LGGAGHEWARAGIETDANDNVYFAGDFVGTIQLDPNGSSAGLLNAQGSRDVFVAKYDPSGEFLWARSFGGSDHDFTWRLAIDQSANLIVTGGFRNTVDFDASTAQLPGVDTFTAVGDADGFVMKLNSDGQFQWVQPMSGSGFDSVNFASTDRLGNIYVGTQSNSTEVAFGSLPPIAAGNGEYHAEVAKIDAGGTYQWVRAFTNGISVPRIKPLVDDRATNPADWSITAVGSFEGQLSLGPFEIVSHGGNDVFVVRVDAATGHETLAATSVGGPGYDREASLGMDQAGNIYVSGWFEQEADFDPYANQADGSDRRISQGAADVFVLKLNESLSFTAVTSFGGPGFDAAIPNALTVSPSGDVLIGGQFEAAINFGHFSLVSAGEMDGFVAALDNGLNLRWVERFGGAGDSGSYTRATEGPTIGDWRQSPSDDGITGLAFDSQGNLYVAGDFKRTANFPNGERRTSNGDADIALMRLDMSQPRIAGNIFADFNDNGLRDDRFREGILAAAGWRVELVNAAGALVDSATPLGNSGNYSFGTVAPGTYTVRLVSPAGWTQTTPSNVPLTVAAGEDPVRVDFGSTTSTQSATYPSTDVPKRIRNNRTVTSQLVVPDNITVFDIDVALDITHGWVSDLNVFLIAPNGTRIELFTHVGGGGDNFAGTILDDDATLGIATSVAPFSGRLRPEGNLFGLEGMSAQGTWTLEITDTFSGFAGDLNNWSLSIFGATPPPPQDKLYYSIANNATVGGVAAANEDILALDNSGGVRVYFDGSDVGLGGLSLDGFDVIAANQILMSFTAAATIPGAGAIDDSDIVLFTATGLGANTAGTFSLYFDGSDVGLTTNAENVDAIHRLDDGRLLVSTAGNSSVPGMSGDAADLLAFNPTSLGNTTTGTWSIYFDASDVGLTTADENVDGSTVDAAGRIYFSTTGNFSVSGISGADEDVFAFTPTTLGTTTSGSFSPTLFFDGSLLGLAANDVTGIDLPPGTAAASALAASAAVLEQNDQRQALSTVAEAASFSTTAEFSPVPVTEARVEAVSHINASLTVRDQVFAKLSHVREFPSTKRPRLEVAPDAEDHVVASNRLDDVLLDLAFATGFANDL
jgi:subtilisin-like proprotein convertase family protein